MSKPKQSLSTTIKAYIDLTRLHFAFVWPLLILSGLFLAFAKDNVFSWELTIKVALIGLFGFEAGLVLNDYVDRNRDKLDVEHDKMDNYWRPFKSKPLAAGLIPGRHAFVFFIILVCITIGLIVTLPYPHNLYIFLHHDICVLRGSVLSSHEA